MKPRVFILAAAIAFMTCGALIAEPQVRQFESPQHVLLGQPVYWIIEVRHPIFESYDLQLQSPAGAQMEVESRTDRRQQDVMITVYRVRLTAQNLSMGGPPAAVLTGAAGLLIPVRAKSVQVTSISGDSMDVRDPELPRFRTPPSYQWTIAGGVAIAVLLAVLAFRWWMKKRAGSARQTLIRNLKEASLLTHGSKPPDPAWICMLLRSELLWGEPVSAATVAELIERGKQTAQHSVLSEALESLEQARYSGNVVRDAAMIEKTVNAAMEILQKR